MTTEEFGKKAGVVTNKATDKWGSAHDLRRAFGTRWAKKVMPATLQRIMRHADIGTTMQYYVGIDADDMADELWVKFGNTPGKNGPVVQQKRTCGDDTQVLSWVGFILSGQGRG